MVHFDKVFFIYALICEAIANHFLLSFQLVYFILSYTHFTHIPSYTHLVFVTFIFLCKLHIINMQKKKAIKFSVKNQKRKRKSYYLASQDVSNGFQIFLILVKYIVKKQKMFGFCWKCQKCDCLKSFLGFEWI